MENKKLPVGELLVYYGYTLMTFGLLWVIKIVIKKAILETK